MACLLGWGANLAQGTDTVKQCSYACTIGQDESRGQIGRRFTGSFPVIGAPYGNSYTTRLRVRGDGVIDRRSRQGQGCRLICLAFEKALKSGLIDVGSEQMLQGPGAQLEQMEDLP